MANTNPRVYHTQQVHYIRKLVNYNTTGIAAGIIIGTLPAGAQITHVATNVTTAFNAATTNVLTVGTTATGGEIATSAENAAGTAGYKQPVAGQALAVPTVDKDVYMSYTQSGTAATAGSATVVISYVPNNDG